MKRSKKLTIFVGLAVLLTAGVAVAAWLVSGTGPGAGKAASATPLTVSAGTATGDLYPGFTGGDVFVKVTNPNAFPVQVTSASIAGPVTPSSCAVSVNPGALSLASTPTIAPGQTADLTVLNALSMGAGADDTCQGIDLAVGDVTVNGTSATP